MLTIPAVEFWEFKARCAELDLAIVKTRMTGEQLMARRNALVEAFAARFGFDATTPMHLDDETLTVTQDGR
jgi:hypothetical protein